MNGSSLFSVEPRTGGKRASRLPSPLRKGRGNEGEGKGVMNQMAHEHKFDVAQQSSVTGKVFTVLPLTPAPLPMKEECKVMFLNVQSKHNLLVHWGCETTFPFDNARSNSYSVCVSGSWLRISARGIGGVPPISHANAN